VQVTCTAQPRPEEARASAPSTVWCRLDLLYTFQGLTQWSQDGGSPYARVTIGPDGALYGTTRIGGDGDGCRELHGCGTVFKLQPQFSGEWKETILHQFGMYDGDHPLYGDVIFDRRGNLYGATYVGGAYLHGAIYQLSPNNGGWTERVIHSFTDADGSMPSASPTFDANGNLYGSTSAGGSSGLGTVYRLQPSALNWQVTVLHQFQGIDGMTPSSGVVSDQAGNLYGVTEAGGTVPSGVVYQLSLRAPGNWNINTLYGFKGTGIQGTYRTLSMDKAGNFYGTTVTEGTYRQGSVFKLTYINGQWVYSTLHDFTGGTDGANPYGALSFDANGNIYGTAEYGGTYGYGVVFRITP